MRNLFPEPKSRKQHRLQRGALHSVFVEESGSPEGLPLLFVHGGPGTGSDPLHARLADAERFRLIQFDQRGCGRSEPLGELKENTLQDLISDMEAIREELQIDKWMLFGHGWGATLAVAYAQQHPDRVSGMVLSSLFLGRQADIEWSLGVGAARFFPDAWEKLVEGLPEPVDTSAVLAAILSQLEDSNELRQIQAARRWAKWETTIQVVHPSQSLAEHLQHPHVAISLARLSCHYLGNACFLRENALLDKVSALSGIRAILVHGRFNVVAPLAGARALHQQWQGSELHIIREGSHSLYDPAMTDAAMRAVAAVGAEILGDGDPSVQ